MSNFFFDSSALVKRYIAETGTGWVRSITDTKSGNTILVAYITQVEVVSAAMRRGRDTSISPRTARAVRLIMDRHMSRQYAVVGVTSEVISLAEDLLEAYPLRAYDSVQLASALESNKRFVSAGINPLIFVSSDNRLLTIAGANGLTTDDPNNYT